MPDSGIERRGHSDILRSEEIIEICAAAADLGVTKIRVTGGEPLVRKGIVPLCAELGKLGVELVMTTNGILLAQYADELKQAGVSRVNISLDTLNPERFRELTRGGELSSVLRGIEAAKRAGLSPIKLNAVALRGINDDEFEKFRELTLDGTTEVRFIELMPIGEGKALWDKSFYTLDAETLPERMSVIAPISHAFCPTCNRLRLTADGKLKPCLHSAEEYNIRGLHGNELKNAIINAANSKPKQHAGLTSDNPSESRRGMSRIGG
jgi:cyclic pyranopterin phosphate synthase